MRRITKVGGLLAVIGAALAALVWLIKDRLLGPETVPVRAEGLPAVPKAAEPAVDGTKDDLSDIVGVGPVYQERLAQAGMTSFRDIAAASVETIASAARVQPGRAEDWRRQAADLIT